MAWDDNIRRFSEPLNDALREAVAKAYEAGFAAGEASMKAKFRELVSDDNPIQLPLPTPSPTDRAGRAVRGAVGKVIAQVLRGANGSGLKASEVEKAALAIDPSVSAKSVGNELRRYKDDKYSRDEFGRWSLVSN